MSALRLLYHTKKEVCMEAYYAGKSILKVVLHTGLPLEPIVEDVSPFVLMPIPTILCITLFVGELKTLTSLDALPFLWMICFMAANQNQNLYLFGWIVNFKRSDVLR